MPDTIVVMGSLNMDFVVLVERLPAPGETTLGSNFQMLPGGKGANQACAAAKLAGPGVVTKMIGRVGYDVFGDHLKASLSAAGVDVAAVRATKSQPTGVALIWVDRAGQNSIVVASGANHALLASEVEAMRPVFRGSRFALFQLESPLDTVERAMKLARAERARIILDPAPARPLSDEMLAFVDILTPNETEASILLGSDPGRLSLDEAPQIARKLRERGPGAVLLKLGDRGCYYLDESQDLYSPAFQVEARDATAAGDIFNGALAAALAEQRNIETALRFANAAAAISVTRMGAQTSVPSRRELEEFIR